MIKLIEGSFASFYPRETDAMFRNRAETFWDRLRWRVEVKDGRERDHYDDLPDVLYAVSVDPDSEAYQGSFRMLPTLGPNMYDDTFRLAFGDCFGPEIRDRAVWDVSRLTLAAGAPKHTFAELAVAIGEIGALAGLYEVVAVCDVRLMRALKRVDADYLTIAQHGDVYAILVMTAASALQRVRRKTGIEASVLDPEHHFIPPPIAPTP